MLRTFSLSALAFVTLATSANRVCIENKTDFEFSFFMDNLRTMDHTMPSEIYGPNQTQCLDIIMGNLFKRNLILVTVVSVDGGVWSQSEDSAFRY